MAYMHGILKGLIIKDVSLFTSGIDLRPAIVLDDVSTASFSEVQANGVWNL